MSKKLNLPSALGILLIGISLCSVSEGLSQTTNYTWNNSTNLWATNSAWSPSWSNGGSGSGTGNTNVAVFAATQAGNNSVLLGSDRTVFGLIFTNGANAYTFGSQTTAKQLDIMSGVGLQNVSGQNQIFNLSVANNGTGIWTNSSGSTTTFNNGLQLTTANSTANRTLTLGGAGTWNVASTIANGGPSGTNIGTVNITATGTTTLSGNNTYDGRTTMNASGGTLTLSGNNSGAAGGVTLTAGTLNLNNSNAVGTGVLDLGVVTGSSIGSSIINNTSGGALTYLGLSGVTWSGVATNATGGSAGIQFGTSASTRDNNMDFGTGLVTVANDRYMNIAGTNVTISMGILNVTGKSAKYEFNFDGAGNTIDFDGWRIGAAPDQDKAVAHHLKGSANVNMGAIVNGTPGTNGITYANGVSFNSEGVTRLTGNNTYTGATEFIGSGINIISGNNSAAVGNVTIAGTSGSGSTPVVRLDNVNGISSSSSLLGASGSAQTGTLDLRAAGDFSLNSFGTVSKEGNNMIFTNSSGSQKTLAFTAANNYITTTNSGGKSLYNNSANLLLDFDGNIEIGGESSGGEATTFAGEGNFNVDGNLLDNGTGLTRTLRKTGDGTLTLRGSANSIRGSTLLERGKLDLYGNLTASTNILVSTIGAAANAARGTAILNVNSGATLLTNSTTTVYSGGNLIMNGTGGAVDVEINGLLGGSGTNNGIVTLKSGSFLTPGNSPGTLTAESADVLGGSTYNWEISALRGTAGTNWDLLNVTDILDMSAITGTGANKWNLVVTADGAFTGWTDNSSYEYIFAQAANLSLSAAFSTDVGTDVTNLFNITTSGITSTPNGDFKVVVGSANGLTTLNLVAVAIPEPSTGSLMMFGLGGLVLTRLLRRKVS